MEDGTKSLQDKLDNFAAWRGTRFFRYQEKMTKDNKFAELGMDGYGRIAVYIDGKEHRAYTQPYTAIDDFDNL